MDRSGQTTPEVIYPQVGTNYPRGRMGQNAIDNGKWSLYN